MTPSKRASDMEQITLIRNDKGNITANNVVKAR